MDIIVFDVESTGLPFTRKGAPQSTYTKELKIGNQVKKIKVPYTPRGDVIQLAYFRYSTTGEYNPQLCMCYTNPSEPISDEAIAVHGITNNDIQRLSGGTTLEAFLKDTPDTSKYFHKDGVIFVGHNIGFDMKAVNSDLQRTNNIPIDFGTQIKSLEEITNKNGRYYFDTMHVFRERLGTAFKEKFRLPRVKNPKLIEAAEFFGWTEEKLNSVLSKKIPDVSFHDARFDVLVTWLIFNKLVKLK